MKTEELKALGLNDEQVQRVFAMNGEDIKREKQAAAEAKIQLTAAQQQLSEANQKLEGYDPEWKQKAAQVQQQAQQEIADLKMQHAASNAVAGLKFTSDSARQTFLAKLAEKKLPVQDDGSLLGFDDFVKSYKADDPGAFVREGYPQVRDGGDPTHTPSAKTTRDQFAEWFGQVAT